eukprot:jgi/Ulvmu1/7393/UM036_0053.1
MEEGTTIPVVQGPGLKHQLGLTNAEDGMDLQELICLGLLIGLAAFVVNQVEQAQLTANIGKNSIPTDEDRQRLWDAARSGDVNRVKALLRLHRFHPNTFHHVIGHIPPMHHLVLDIAAVETHDQELDRKLCDVLRVLADEGWLLGVTSFQTGENALQILARQSGQTTKRIAFFNDPRTHPDSPARNKLATLQKFWQAARAGDAATVSSMLREDSIPVNAQHRLCRTSLVIEIAKITARTDEDDRGLAAVLHVLAQNGWTLARQESVTKENPLHILATHPKRLYIAHRLKVLLTAEFLHPEQHSMLAGRDRDNKLPEESAPKTGDDRRRLREVLRQARLAVQHAEQQRRQGNGEGGCVKVPQLLLSSGDEAPEAVPLELRFVRVPEGEAVRTDVVVEEVP